MQPPRASTRPRADSRVRGAALVALLACGDSPATPRQPATQPTATDTTPTVSTPLEYPALLDGTYEYTAFGTAENTCGMFEYLFFPFPLTFEWLDDSTFSLLYNAANLGCTVDVYGKPSCEVYTNEATYYGNTRLFSDVLLDLSPIAEDRFALVEHMSWGCDGPNCDVMAYTYEIDSFPCTLAFASEFLWARELEGDTPQTVAVSLQVRDAAGYGLEGEEVSMGDEVRRTDESGVASFDAAPSAPILITAAPVGRLGISLVGTAGPAGGAWGRSTWTPEEIGAIAASLGLTYDPEAGMVMVNAYLVDGDGYLPLAGVAATLDVDGVAFVEDGGSSSGYSLGNVTLTGQYPAVWFMNVPPGPVHVTTTNSAGLACQVLQDMPVSDGVDVTVAPQTITTFSLACQ